MRGVGAGPAPSLGAQSVWLSACAWQTFAMATFEYRTVLPHRRNGVFDWFSRPGALVRLWPPFGGSVRSEPSDGIAIGSESVVGVGPPGWPGLAGAAAASLLPSQLRPELSWRARHTQLDPGHSFSDVMVTGPMSSWRHHHVFSDDPGGTIMRDMVDYELPAILNNRVFKRSVESELARIFAYRAQQLRADLDFHEATQAAPLTVAVTGASGLIGRQVCALLGGGGHRVIRMVRRPARNAAEISWDPDKGVLDPDDLAACDAVVHLAGHPIGGRFTARNREEIMGSRRRGTALVARTLAKIASDGRQRTLVSASAIGYYGAQPHEQERAVGKPICPLDEDVPSGSDFLAGVVRVWEEQCRPAAEAGVRVVNVRTGLVLSPAGGLLTRFLPLYLAGVGGPLGSGQWQSWIGIDDIASIHAFSVLNDGVEGAINAVAPEPVTAREFATTLGRVLHRPAAVPVPSIGPKLLLGSDGARELAEADQRVSAARLEGLGYGFRHRDLESQLRHVLGR
ncbi:hypothetical protein SAMN02745244_02342 [Tessaracoccus bendigoensis DSM 12906]|uniref:TIGR01777 family protein n=2 Tax=Tessaracoccus TaxID=72763 RepID=A0A1M6INT7_9ACTN|nr:hypothetical protein SAMN02745244_02342 [Tessaracoccus bendigoensis DSM 12906]